MNRFHEDAPSKEEMAMVVAGKQNDHADADKTRDN